MLDYSKSFIEMQFPVSKISKESYKERKANLGQTLTGIGKWWGRKPLILVRATILGLLMPVSDNPKKDRDIFLKILTMDEDGLWLRKIKNIPVKEVYTYLNANERDIYFSNSSTTSAASYASGLSKKDKLDIQKMVFNRFSYDKKLTYCDRPENYHLDDKVAWDEINYHLQTSAKSLQELTRELGKKKFGHAPIIGDCFSGGGSIPFEAARMGADVFASDLNPIASFLTWASINIAGASDDEINDLKEFQKMIYSEVDRQILDWKVETNENGHRADTYLYCNEVICPECSYKVPLAPSWIIGKGTKTVALLEDNGANEFDIKIIQGASEEQFSIAEENITVKSGSMYCPHCRKNTPMSAIRGDRKNSNGDVVSGLRKWGKTEFVPNPNDVFQERLYAIRYLGDKARYYVAPNQSDIDREDTVIKLLEERFVSWQDKGYIPNSIIEDGEETSRLQKERGWQYWHQLFNPRQLLIIGLFNKIISEGHYSHMQRVAGLLGINKIVNFNSKLSMWVNGAGVEKVVHVFTNQALNTMYNYGTRPMVDLKNIWYISLNASFPLHEVDVRLSDAREVKEVTDIWITDPPYADAVNYHELSEFFLSWDKNLIQQHFPEWYTDSKRVLAVKGVGQSFNQSMIDIYKNLANKMEDDGYQVVMFTHQDVSVWAELAMILWSAGLQVVSAWNIATETDASGLKSGNYVKGTVLLTLKKQSSNEMAFQDEIYDEIKYEVKRIIDSMKDIDHKDDPDFSDADYLLASYAASLKVLTAYKEIEGVDVSYWLAQSRDSKEENPVASLINKAVRIAYDYLIPDGFDRNHWPDLKPEERFFIRGLELEMNGSYKMSSYQELARGFGVIEYKDMFADFKANSARIKTPDEYKMTSLNNGGFGSTLTRHLLVAINETSKTQSTVEGRNYLKNVYNRDNEFWYKKPLMSEILTFIANLEFVDHMEHWKQHAYSAKLLREALKNEGV